MRKLVLLWLFILSLPVLAHPTGEFMVGDFDGEEFLFRALFQDGMALVSSSREGFTSQSPLRDAGANRHTFTLNLEEKSFEVTVFRSSDDELVFYVPQWKAVMKGWKRAEKPSWLEGRWEAEDQRAFVFSDKRLSLEKRDATFEVDVFPISTQPAITGLILQNEAKNVSVLLYFARVDSNQMLVWDHDDGQVRRFTRRTWLAP